ELPHSLRDQAESLRQMLCLRELARHYLLKGYQVIRRILLEWDRRLGLDGGVFFLSRADLESDLHQAELATRSSRTRRRRRFALSLPAPEVLFSDDLEAI